MIYDVKQLNCALPEGQMHKRERNNNASSHLQVIYTFVENC